MENKRIIIFDLPEYEGKEFRAYCHFGYHYLINNNWWVEIQVKVFRKKYILFGPNVFFRWSKIYECWLANNPDTMDQLRIKCEKIYDENILMPNRIRQRAMDL